MSYFAVALARSDEGWVGEEMDLDELADLDSIAEHLRDLTGDGPGPALLLLDQDDEYVAVLRVDAGLLSEPHVFLSDVRAVYAGGPASVLWEGASDHGDEEDSEDEGTRPVAEPVGETSLLADLGVPADALLALCAEEGLLPADVHTALCERIGCLDALEALREG